VIELADGSRLEPVNIGNYAAQIKDGKKVWVSYHEVQGGSICMVGKIVVIDCLSDR
jgi:hypothetical protein